nr:ATP synthase F0 subunit B [Candidatus Eremiobacteraeota bacterium]
MGFLSVDGTFWIQLINFAIFFAILNAVFLKPVGRALAKRRAYIDSLREGYDAANGELARLQSEMEGKRAAARREAEATLSKARATASNETAALATD